MGLHEVGGRVWGVDLMRGGKLIDFPIPATYELRAMLRGEQGLAYEVALSLIRKMEAGAIAPWCACEQFWRRPEDARPQ